MKPETLSEMKQGQLDLTCQLSQKGLFILTGFSAETNITFAQFESTFSPTEPDMLFFSPGVNVPCPRIRVKAAAAYSPERRRRRRSLRLSPPQRCNFHFSKSGGARGGGGEMGRKKVISAAAAVLPQRLFLFPTAYLLVSFPIMC